MPDNAVRNAKDRAARHSELALERHNSDFKRELALDVLAQFIDGIYPMMGDVSDEPCLKGRGRRLAWALALTEQRTDLKPHEQRLLEDAWKRVVELGEEQKWETMGS